ncbi:MAG: fused response regulator/phosphatase [Gammaproteobacteria bacterium]|nr:fused response regulator/phosphatase [Gammaproteobacteria bacterium]
MASIVFPAQDNNGCTHPCGSEDHDTIKILIADDDITNRLVLQRLLDLQGYQTILSENGQQAVEVFHQESPDLILMDIMMPVMDGYAATAMIKAHCDGRFVPIIFLTAVTQEEALVDCINSGGDDFLTKPYNHIILNAKIEALLRIRQLYNTINEQKNQIARYHQRMEGEIAVATSLFEKILNPGSLSRPNIKYLLSPMSLFNGDLLIAADKPSGGLHVLIGDFTGHGLGAATGALPAATVFYEMTNKGYSIAEIVAVINKKLKYILPTGMFMAACAVDMDFERHTVSVWNGGLPDALLFNAEQGKITHRITSNHLPLGIIDSIGLDGAIQVIPVSNQDKLYLYTDGVIETTDCNNTMFGQGRLESIFSSRQNSANIFETIKQNLATFRANREQSDDVTLLELTYDEASLHAPEKVNKQTCVSANPASHWEFTFNLEVDALKSLDPLPLIVQSIVEMQGLKEQRQQLYTIISELFYNALEHGLLGMDSALKNTMDGFSKYYGERGKRLAELNEGYININIKHHSYKSGGQLLLRIEDSGKGFDYVEQLKAPERCREYNGKGLRLLVAMCKSVNFIGKGNIAEVVYVW